ncbi:MAG: hypothetical protein WA996_20935 [Candidatus Promineifilaceae bacterium]
MYQDVSLAVRHLFSRGITVLLSSVFALGTVILAIVAASYAAGEDALPLRSWTIDNKLIIDSSPLEPADEYDRNGGLFNSDLLGGQRDRVNRDGSVRIQWDGDDGSSEEFEYSGLSGLDITDGHLRDRFVIEILEGAPAGMGTLTVHSDEQNASSQTFSLATAGRVSLPLADFAVESGMGADFTNVGAISLELQNVSPELVLGSLEVDSGLGMVQSEFLVMDLDGNGKADPGDMVEQRVTIRNDQDSASGSITFARNLFGRARSLKNDSVATSQGDVVSGNTDGQTVLKVDIGAIASGDSVVVSYRQTLNENAMVPVEVVLQRNDILPGGGGLLADNLNYPVTDGDGAVGFTGDLDDGANDNEFVWHGAGLEWLSTDILSDVTNIERYMGVGNGVAYAMSIILSPGDLDSVWTQDGKLVAEEDPAPDLDGQFITFASRPTMLPGGTAHWISGYADTPGSATQGRVLYRSVDTATPVISAVIKSGDVISGFVLDSLINLNYFFSDNGSHHIQVVDTVGPATEDDFVYLDGDLILREGQPIDEDENWDEFDLVQVNDSGDYLITGNTDGGLATDEFIAYNSKIQVREGDIVAGIPLTTFTSSASIHVSSINNLGQAAYAWGVSGGAEILFFACDASFLASAAIVLATGDTVDVDGNEVPDATVTDFNTTPSAQAFMLAEDGKIYLGVDLDYGSGDLEAVIGMDAPICAVADINVYPESLDSEQFPNEQVIRTLIISNTGNLGLDWDIFEEAGAPGGNDCNPADILWASTDPIGGIIPGLGYQEVEVFFDSIGLETGVYSGGLCIESNDADEPAVRIPLSMTVVFHKVFTPMIVSGPADGG